MDEARAREVKIFVQYGIIPGELVSTKGNFIATAGKFSLNKKNTLMRDGRPVVMVKMQAEIFNALHNHSGRTATWNRIKAR